MKLLDGVDGKLRKAVILLAEKYGGPIKVTSGVRTLGKQAELMEPMNDAQLKLYGGGKAPYVVDIKELRKKQRVSAKEVESILAKSWKKPCFISRHLSGEAVDISRTGLDIKKPIKLRTLLDSSLVCKDPAEASLNCFHVSLKKPLTKA